MTREDMKFDVRALKHRLRRGEVKPSDIEAHLATLPDDAAECETTRTEFVARQDGKNES